jgi:acyl dehydratase/GNAT superfamily N-acetyltransferase
MKEPAVPNQPGFEVADSPSETERFERLVKRYTLTGESEKPLLRAIEQDAPDLAIVRIPTDRPERIRSFSRICDDVVLGDCLVIYERDNERAGEPGELRNPGLKLRAATEADIPVIDELVDIIFETYRNHYTANPLLADFDLVDGYKEWTHGFLHTEGQRCMIAEIDGDVCAFATIRIEDGESEGVLYGVSPKFRGKGVYRDLIRATVRLFMDEGSPRTKVSTQIDTLPVQRVWSTEGFYLTRSYYTLHLNLAGQMMQDLESASLVDTLEVTDELIRDFARTSGDANPIHLDAEAARAAGFPDRILHGVAVEARISEMLGMRHPGPGTIILGSRFRFRGPLVLGHSYRIALFDVKPFRSGVPHAIAVAVHDIESGARVLTGRVTVLHRSQHAPG